MKNYIYRVINVDTKEIEDFEFKTLEELRNKDFERLEERKQMVKEKRYPKETTIRAMIANGEIISLGDY